MERFLEFLYTGTYSDNVNHTWGKPSTVAMVSPEEVQDNLDGTPGVPEDMPAVDEGLPSPSPRQQKSNQARSTGDDDPDENDVEYGPDVSSDSEPEEEYNEYHGESGSDKGPEDAPERSSPGKLTDLEALDKEEAVQMLAEMRNDMALPLRLYIMADKYDVPALRLLARDRFYRAVEVEWEYAECFPDIVDELYLGTPQTDTAMREIVCRIVGSRILDDKVRDKMRSVMVKHGDFAFGVMEYAIHLGRIR